MSCPRVVLLTGNERRHRYAAHALRGPLDLVAVVTEAKASPMIAPETLPESERLVLERHLSERDDVERGLLGGPASFPDVPRRAIATGEVNSLETYAWVEAQRPELLLLFGTSIVRPPLLHAFEGRVVNLHLGLSPYYRGSATNFWPLVNGEPACVGATLHLAVAEVDAGGILAQCRPEPAPTDRAHELGTKALVAALELLPFVCRAYLTGQITPSPQTLPVGRVYRRRDFNAAAVRRLWANLESGMMHDYVARAAEHCAAFPILELVPERLAGRGR